VARNKLLDRSFREVFDNPPAVTKSTLRKKGAKAARKQKIAIAFSKARQAGASV
jgi:hypothetical protein